MNEKINQTTSDSLPFTSRTGCFLVSMLGIVLLALVVGGFMLAFQGEIDLIGKDLQGVRIWLVGAGDGGGFAISRSRKVDAVRSEGGTCLITRTRFVLLRSAGTQPVAEYCECYQGAPGSWSYSGVCTP